MMSTRVRLPRMAGSKAGTTGRRSVVSSRKALRSARAGTPPAMVASSVRAPTPRRREPLHQRIFDHHLDSDAVKLPRGVLRRAVFRPLREVVEDRLVRREVVGQVLPRIPDRSTYKIAFTISRRSWTGLAIPNPLLAERHSAKTGSINAHRASERSAGYARRGIVMPTTHTKSEHEVWDLLHRSALAPQQIRIYLH